MEQDGSAVIGIHLAKIQTSLLDQGHDLGHHPDIFECSVASLWEDVLQNLDVDMGHSLELDCPVSVDDSTLECTQR